MKVHWDTRKPAAAFEYDAAYFVSNFVEFTICDRITNLNRHWRLRPGQEALLSANVGLEFETFCDYSKGISTASMEVDVFTDLDENEFPYDRDTSTNADFPSFNAN